jgi:hypothetical protein
MAPIIDMSNGSVVAPAGRSDHPPTSTPLGQGRALHHASISGFVLSENQKAISTNKDFQGGKCKYIICIIY